MKRRSWTMIVFALLALSVPVVHHHRAAIASLFSEDAVYGPGFVVKDGPENPGRFNGFDVTDLQVPRRFLEHSGPAKDQAPALLEPDVVPAESAPVSNTFAETRVVGVEIGNAARAYPVAILQHHPVVNDVLDGTPIAVTYCAWCDAVAVYDRRVEGDDDPVEFGASGLLVNSNLVLFDRTDHALWSQLTGEALSGPSAGAGLRPLSWTLTSLDDWRAAQPDSTIVDYARTGHDFGYTGMAYAEYFESARTEFAIQHWDDRLSQKEPVVGIRVGDESVAIALTALPALWDGVVGGRSISIEHDRRTGRVRVIEGPPGAHVVHAFWFAWAAFHPDSSLN